MKKAVSVAMAAVMALSMIPAVSAMASDDVSITIFNSKMEIQSQLEEMAAKYS